MAWDELWLVRHGESVANVAASRAERDGLDRVPVTERDADVALSPAGVEQARALAGWMRQNAGAVERFYVSPYLRARQTLAVSTEGLSGLAPALVEERVRDRELGILDLLTRRGIERHHPEEAARRRRLGKYYHRPPGGESWADVSLRLRSFLAEALPGPQRSALIVAHDAVIVLLIGLLTGLGEEELLTFAASHPVLNASVTHLVRDDEGWRLAGFSDVAHLRAEDAPVTAHPGSHDVDVH